jgi:hypothetical protein
LPHPQAGVPYLPKDKKQLARLIQQHVDRESQALETKWGRWLLAYYYLNGFRRFKALDSDGTVIHASDIYEEKQGAKRERRLATKIGEFIKQVNDTSGVISSMNLAPTVQPGDLSLGARQEAAGGQVLLDAAVSGQNLTHTKKLFAYFQTTYGMSGLTPHVYNNDMTGLMLDYEVINPRELMPFPSLGWNLADLRGVVRRRTIPYEQLKITYPGKVPSDVSKLQTFKREIGRSPDPEHESAGDLTLSNYDSRSMNRSSALGGEGMLYTGVIVNEVRLFGPSMGLERVIVSSGDTILYDESYEGAQFDIGIGRFYDTGSFYGAGLFDTIFSLVRELENMVEDFIQNIKNADKYPILIVPDGQIKDRAWSIDNGQKLRYMTVKTDTTLTMGDKPITPLVVKPVDSGSASFQGMDALSALIDRNAATRDLIREKGRVDGGPGLAMLQEEERRSLQVPLQNAVDAFTTAHRAGLSKLSNEVLYTQTPVPVNRLSLDLAGVVINQADSTVSFENNPIPNILRLKVGVKQEEISSKLIMKQEAVGAFQMHGDINRFLIHCFDNGLDIPFDARLERAAYEKVVVDILSLYGNGLEPGEIIVNPDSTNPELQIYVLSGFMNSVAYANASAEVRTKMLEYKEFLKGLVGGVLPPGMPDPFMPVNELEGVSG